MYSTILKNIIFPLYQINLQQDQRIIPYLNFLNKTQWWSYSELEKLQFKLLKKLLKHANDNVPYYHNMFKKLNFKPGYITSINDLKKLPILTRKNVNKNFNELCARNHSKQEFTLTYTGGSTAEPMRFYIDKKWNACNMAAAYRSWGWGGYRVGDKMAYLWCAYQDLKNSTNIEKIRNNLLRTIKLDAFNLTNKNMDNYIQILKKFKPRIINAYASSIFTFAEYINKKEIDFIYPKSILTTADKLYDYQRKSIEKAFNCEIYDYYSGRDTSLQAAECSKHSGYHMSIENAVVEFIKDDEDISPGETGNLIITDLCNYAMPFIRYEIGDLGTLSDEKCLCGRNLPVIKSLRGRTYDYILTSDGRLLSGVFFHATIIYHKIEGIKEFQVIQKTKNQIIIYIVKNQEQKTQDIYRFISLIQKTVGEEIELKVRYVSSIKRTKTGKLRHVISYLNKLDLAKGKY